MLTPSSTSRHLDWDALLNARDLGGLPIAGGGNTQWRAVIRADHLGRLTPRGWQALLAYGVRTVIDLRSSREAAAEPYSLPPGAPLAHLHLPMDQVDARVSALFAAATSRAEVYGIGADHYPDYNAAVLRAVAAAPAGGVLIHCHSGKDRTGTIACFLLGIVGVPAGEIAADYAESEARLWPDYERRLAAGTAEPGGGLFSQPRADAATMRTFLNYLTGRYGGVRGYLTHAGLRTPDFVALRHRLVAGGSITPPGP
jgi:protein tyrosine/serine phosphatase